MNRVSDRAPSSPLPYPPGTLLAGKYRVERLLGEGGMGWVVLAVHEQLEQRVALKFMRESHAAGRPEAVGRFLREARAAARIESEHVARVSDVGTLEGGAPYLVMEYLQGQDLDAFLAVRAPLSSKVAVEYALQACEGLAEAHAVGIVHRDLKPANLFLARRKDGSVRVKLLDFGISKLAERHGKRSQAGITSTQTIMGSPLYMAPEQMRSAKNVDLRADIWSLGIILYEMLGGVSPFDGETLPLVCARIMTEQPASLRTLRPDVPRALDDVVLRCLEKDPARRFASVGSLVEALAPFGGPAERAAAERIRRIANAGATEAWAGSASPEADEIGTDSPPANGVRNLTKTSASFATVRPAAPSMRRRASLALPLTGAALLVAAAVIGGGVVSKRAQRPFPASAATAAVSAPGPIAPTSSNASTAAPPSSSTAATPGLLPEAVPAPASAYPPAAASSASGTRATGGTAIPALPTAATARPQPVRTKASLSPQARPSGTTAFGGRD